MRRMFVNDDEASGARSRSAVRALNPLLDVAGALAGAELDDPELGQMVRVERILSDDLLDLPARLADRQDDPAIARDLAARDEEVAGREYFFRNATCAVMWASISASGTL